jgi:IMP dehydrogenase/GMP reductase
VKIQEIIQPTVKNEIKFECPVVSAASDAVQSSHSYTRYTFDVASLTAEL